MHHHPGSGSSGWMAYGNGIAVKVGFLPKLLYQALITLA
jgi:hypothetical protein